MDYGRHYIGELLDEDFDSEDIETELEIQRLRERRAAKKGDDE
jgi:hypothetical protein